jgi:hypothetical protein
MTRSRKSPQLAFGVAIAIIGVVFAIIGGFAFSANIKGTGLLAGALAGHDRVTQGIEKRFRSNGDLDVAEIRGVLDAAEESVALALDQARQVSFSARPAGWLCFLCSALVTVLAAYFGVSQKAEPAGPQIVAKRQPRRFMQLAVLGAIGSVAGGMGSRLSDRNIELQQAAGRLVETLDQTRRQLLEVDPSNTVETELILSRLRRAIQSR